MRPSRSAWGLLVCPDHEILEMNASEWPPCRLLNTHSHAVKRHEFRGAPTFPFPFVASFPQDLIQGAHIGACGKKPAHRVANVMASLLLGRSTARNVQSRHKCDVGVPFLEDVCVEGTIPHGLAFSVSGIRTGTVKDVTQTLVSAGSRVYNHCTAN
jgi:hypothetical protein